MGADLVLEERVGARLRDGGTLADEQGVALDEDTADVGPDLGVDADVGVEVGLSTAAVHERGILSPARITPRYLDDPRAVGRMLSAARADDLTLATKGHTL